MESLAGRVILLWGWRRFTVAFAAGAFAALAQAPFDFFAACFVSFPVLVWLLEGTTASAGAGFMRWLLPSFAVGWWFGFGYFIAGLWWIGAAVLVEGDTFAWALPFAVIGVPALLAVFYGLAALAARILWTDGVGRIVALAFAFGVAEWLRATVLTGFPWNAIGYAAMPVPLLMQSVRMAGLFGMNVLAVFVFCAPALLGSGRHRRAGIAVAALLAALHVGYGYARLVTAPAPTRILHARIVQPSIDQTQKWDQAERDRIFKAYLDLSTSPAQSDRAKPQLIVWPETAVPFILTQRPDALSALSAMVKDGQMLLAGAVRSEGAENDAEGVRYYNSIVAVDSAGEITDAVDKVHLVPYGEYVPLAGLLKAVGAGTLVDAVGPFTPGAMRHTLSVADGVEALPFICYEIIFPRLVLGADAGANLIVNITNDAWFGDTPGPYQHFRQAQVRAVEAGLPMLRAANNGISAVVDPYGRVVDALAMNAVGVLDADVPVGATRVLAFGRPGFNGLLIMAAFGLLALMMAVVSRFRIN